MAAAPTNQLTDCLLRAQPALAPAVAQRAAQLEQALIAALVCGRAAWPELAVDDEAFVLAIGRGIGEAADPIPGIGTLAIEDLYLAQACATGAPAALQAFAALCDSTMHASLRQMGLAHDVVEELAQDVRTKLFVGPPPRIATFTGRAQLTSWVRTIATRAAVDRLRQRRDVAPDDEMLEQLPDPSGGPELEHFRQTYHAEFKEAFEEAFASLDVRERNVLRHYFVDRLTSEDIGALYGVHKTTASRWLEAARTALSKRTRAGFQQRLKVMPSELDSILRLLQSQIDLSLPRVLAG